MADEDFAPSSHDIRTQFMPSSDTPTRVSIIEAVQSRSADRWVEFYGIYNPMLAAYFDRRGLSQGEVQDLVQEVFLKLCKSIHTYDSDRTRFRSWLFTIARNTLIDHARARKAQQRAVDGWATRILQEASDEEHRQRIEFERSHHTRILRFAFEEARRQSSELAWSCFERSIVQRQAGAEVAAALNLTTNLVYVNSSRVFQRVKQLCRRYDEDLKQS